MKLKRLTDWGPDCVSAVFNLGTIENPLWRVLESIQSPQLQPSNLLKRNPIIKSQKEMKRESKGNHLDHDFKLPIHITHLSSEISITRITPINYYYTWKQEISVKERRSLSRGFPRGRLLTPVWDCCWNLIILKTLQHFLENFTENLGWADACRVQTDFWRIKETTGYGN